MEIKNKTCRKCGNCCKQGGPALHSQDLDIIKTGKLPISSLITIRKGELAHNPQSDAIQPVKNEIVKIVGTGRQWDCCYFDDSEGCTIYDFRPEACRVLECWDTDAILELVEKDTLSRQDILDSSHPLIPVIAEHEKICPCNELQFIRDNYITLTEAKKAEIARQVRDDLRFRARVINDFELKLSEELFYFGRPFFQLLQPFGVRVTESEGDIRLTW